MTGSKRKLRKASVLLWTLILAAYLCACGYTKITYPNIQYNHSSSAGDVSDKYIFVRDGYQLSGGNPYDTCDTESGYDIILHFEPVD